MVIRTRTLIVAILLPAGIMWASPRSTLRDARAEWPQFRGPTGQGIATTSTAPLVWSEEENIAWKIPIPGYGLSSPVVASGQVWLTTALDDGRSQRALCFDEEDGRLLHDIELFTATKPEPKHDKNSYATPTPVIDGSSIFVNFGPAGTACLNPAGEIVWKTLDLAYHPAHGAGSSPILYGDLIILNCDGNDTQFVAALDKHNGRVVWKTLRLHSEAAHLATEANPNPRPDMPRMAYSTPLVIHTDNGDQLISTAAHHVAAYDPRTGEELWWYGYDGFSVVARPLFAHGLVFAIGIEDQASTYVMYAIRPNAHGRIAESELAWELRRSVPAVPSPVVVGNELFLIHDGGTATCIDALSGNINWRKRMSGEYTASPMAADGRIYFVNEQGDTTVLAAGSTWRKLAENHLDGRFLSSGAISEDSLFFRSDTHLYRISTHAQSSATASSE